MILLSAISQSELNQCPDQGAFISIRKMLPNGPNLEEFAGNEQYLQYGKYVMPYSTDFVAFMAGMSYGKGKETETENRNGNETSAFEYQTLIKKYIEYGTPYRGVLLNQGLGSGKSRTCIMATETFRKAGIPVIFIGPASLRLNFIRELMKWGERDITESNYATALKIIEKGYSFISANAGNILVQLAKLGIGFPNTYDNYANAGVAKYLLKNPGVVLNYPRNSVIILEEFHNLNQKFSSASSITSKKVFSLLYNSKDCKFIAMSGTPIINNPFEICSMLNILSGPLIDGSSLFPLDKDVFTSEYFKIEDDVQKITNVDELKARMMGLISYYAGAESNKELYPDLIYEDTTIITMSPEQNVIHDHILEQEISTMIGSNSLINDEDDPISRLKKLLELSKLEEDKYSHNSYRIFSRAACNFVWNIEADDVQKPDVQQRDFTLDFIDVDYADFDIIKQFFYSAKETIMLSKSEIIEKINNFPFSSDVEFDWFNYINGAGSSSNVKDILTCAICYTYFGILKRPKILKNPDLGFIKIKKPQKYENIAKYLTPGDISNLHEMVKSRKTKLSEAITKMTLDKERYFSASGIARHGPKMAAVYHNIINGKGSLRCVGMDKSIGIGKKKVINEDAFDDYTDIDGFDGVDGIDGNDEEVDVDDEEDGEDGEEIGSNTSHQVIEDPSLYLITTSSILYKEELVNLEFHEIFERLKGIDNKKFIDALLQTNDKYIIYTSIHYAYFEKLFIKGANMYGHALMKYRNYLKGNMTDDYEQTTKQTQVISYPECYNNNNAVEGGPALIYSEFNNAEGIAIFAKVLEYNGFAYYDNTIEVSAESFSPKYAIISGNIGMSERQEIVEAFNHPLNIHGQFIQLLLCTSAAAEGINLKYIRQVHILEPFWHNIKIQQVIGRARRLFSHASLDITERNVHIYKYVAKGSVIESTDEYLHSVSKKKDAIISEISAVMQSVSIDCRNNSKPKDVDKCLSFSGNQRVAFSLQKNKKEEQKKVVETNVSIATLPGLGSYKTTFEGKPAEYSELYQINISPNHKFYSKYEKFAGKFLYLFPIYDTNKIKDNHEFVIVAYGHLLLSGKIIPFIKSIIVKK